MGVTIKDVANQANVSVKTVSRVINNKNNVKQETREKVTAAIAKLDFHPNANARNLALNYSRIIALCIAYNSNYVFSNQYFSEILRGINEVCNKLNYQLLFQARPDCDYLEILKSGRADGLLLSCVRLEEELLEKIVDAKFPTVLIGKGSEKLQIPWIEIDDELGSYMATKHLLQLGHRQIGYLGGPRQYVSSGKRMEGFKKALFEYNLAPDPDLIICPKQPDIKSGFQAMHQLLTGLRWPTAVMVFNDLMAAGVLEALAEKQIKVPEQMAVVGFDDIDLAKHTHPALTTIRQPSYDKGALATQMLIDLINGKTLDNPHVLLKPRIIVRKSCGSGKYL